MNPTCDKIKVIHVITRFDKGGSAENTFLTVCGLDKACYDVLLVMGASPPRHPDDREAKAIEANIATAHTKGVRLIGLPHLIRELRPLSDLFAFFSLIRVIRREKPQIVHTHTSKAGILGRWAAFLCRVPVIIHTPHGHVFWGYFKPGLTRLFILLERWTAHITTVIVALTPQEKKDHLAYHITVDDKMVVIHSGVDLALFHSAPDLKEKNRVLLNISSDVTVVATVGRLTAVKGHDTLIRAVAELIHRGEKIFLVLLGDGELRRDLEELTAHLGIVEQVCFLGWCPDVARLLSACDIFCLPSRNEGMGKVLVEAMAMGKPIIASSIGGIPDIVRSGENGILVPVGDAAALAEAIALLGSDPEKRKEMGERGREKATVYSSEAMLNKINRLYESFAGLQGGVM